MHHSIAFDAYFVLERRIEGGKEKKEGLKERIQVTAEDTNASLKRKRNGGVCEFEGCEEKENTEWHHHYKTMPAEKRIRGMGGGMGGGGVYMNISKYTGTKNENAQEAYAEQLQTCTLLCTKHHTHTHTHHSKQERLRKHAVAMQINSETFASLHMQHGLKAAVKTMAALRKLGNHI
jgi:hypothetical protein